MKTDYTLLPVEKLVATILNAIATMQVSDIDRMVAALSDIIADSERSDAWAAALYCRAKVRILLYSDNPGGLEDALTAYYYYRASGNERNQCDSGITVAFCYMRAGLIERAVELLSSSHILAKKNNMVKEQGRSLKLLADAHGIMQDYESAVRYAQNAIDTYVTNNLPGMIIASLNALSQGYSYCGNHKAALAAADRALEHSKATSDPLDMELAYNMKSMAYSLAGDYKKALFWIKKSEQSMKDLPATTQRRWQVLLEKSLYLYQDGKTEQALRLTKDILHNSPITQDNIFLRELHTLLMRIYTTLGDKANARKHSKIAAELQLQLSGEELRQNVKVMMVAFNAERFQLEAHLERARAERLQSELATKEKELTLLALSLAQKNQMLSGIEQKLQALEKSMAKARKSVQMSMRSVVNDVKSDITSTKSSDKSWEVFEQQFVTIHPGFVARLSHKHPNFKPMELRLCALLKVSLSTKQIANILCIDTASVDVYRSRIRKKIGMERGANLMAYLAGI